MPTIQIIWATASGMGADGAERVSTTVFGTQQDGSDVELCEELFHQTNLYAGPLWDAMQPLPEERSHTALSVGDYILVDGRMYRCAMLGWTRTEEFISGLGFLDPGLT